MAKYLHQEGCNITVICSKDGSYPAIDEQLGAEIHSDWTVHRCKSFEPISLFNRLMGRETKKSVVGMDNSSTESGWWKRLVTKTGLYLRANVFIPDARRAWVWTARPKLAGLLKTSSYDAVITTGPPQSCHLIALSLRKKSKFLWIADLRDPWTSAYYNHSLNKSPRSQRIDLALESDVIGTADLVTVVSPAMQEEFLDRNANTKIIFNGYDHADFDSVAPAVSTDKFIMSYIGTIKNLEIQEQLWQVINELRSEDQIFKEKFRLEFTGNVSGAVKQSLKDAGLETITTYHGFADHRIAIDRMMSSDALLFIIANLPGSQKVVTGKIFEYMASETPIFGIGPKDGGAEYVLRESGHPGLFDYEDTVNMKIALQKLVAEKFQQKKSRYLCASTPERYSRQNMARQLLKLIKSH